MISPPLGSAAPIVTRKLRRLARIHPDCELLRSLGAVKVRAAAARGQIAKHAHRRFLPVMLAWTRLSCRRRRRADEVANYTGTANPAGVGNYRTMRVPKQKAPIAVLSFPSVRSGNLSVCASVLKARRGSARRGRHAGAARAGERYAKRCEAACSGLAADSGDLGPSAHPMEHIRALRTAAQVHAAWAGRARCWNRP